MKSNGKAVSTISRNLASLRSFYQYLYKTKVVKEDPTLNLESPKIERKPPKILTSDQVELLLEQPKCVDLKGYRDKAMLELVYATGIRVTELISLNLDDIDIENKTIRCVGKNKARTIPIGSLAVNALKEYLDKSRNVLLKYQLYNLNTFQHHIFQLLRKEQLKFPRLFSYLNWTILYYNFCINYQLLS